MTVLRGGKADQVPFTIYNWPMPETPAGRRHLQERLISIGSVSVFEGMCPDLTVEREEMTVHGRGSTVPGLYAIWMVASGPLSLRVTVSNSTSAAFGVKFNDRERVMMTSAYTGQTAPFGGENGWLAPGQGVLLSLEK